MHAGLSFTPEVLIDDVTAKLIVGVCVVDVDLDGRLDVARSSVHVLNFYSPLFAMARGAGVFCGGHPPLVHRRSYRVETWIVAWVPRSLYFGKSLIFALDFASGRKYGLQRRAKFGH